MKVCLYGMFPVWKERKVSKYLQRYKEKLSVVQSCKVNNNVESLLQVAQYIALVQTCV